MPTLASHQVSTFAQDQALRQMTPIFACRMTAHEILPSHRSWRYMDPVALGHIQAFLHGELSGFKTWVAVAVEFGAHVFAWNIGFYRCKVLASDGCN